MGDTDGWRSEFFMISRKRSPCMGCEDRRSACHDSCERYLKWKAHIEEVKASKAEYKRNPTGRRYKL